MTGVARIAEIVVVDMTEGRDERTAVESEAIEAGRDGPAHCTLLVAAGALRASPRWQVDGK